MELLKDIATAFGIVLFAMLGLYGVAFFWCGHNSQKQMRENEYNIAKADEEIRKGISQYR
jgi:DNA/RNA endonuclease YhcR with UshA esterase domain